MSIPPWPIPAIVISQDPDNYALNVALSGPFGGQMPAIPVKVLTHGPRDFHRGSYPELPLPGTHGLVVFARGDNRSGHWLGATDPNLLDSNTLSPGIGNTSYSSHYDGGWSWRGQDGTAAEVLADGSYFLSGTALPTPTRHAVDEHQRRGRVAFGVADRQTAARQAVVSPVTFTHRTGASVTVSASGAVSVVAAAGQPMVLSAGGTMITVTPAGDVHISAGGAAQAVRLADGSLSTVLRAQ